VIEAFNLADVNLPQLLLVCCVAFSVSILSGLAGYGAGLVLPAFLAPVVGITNVIPVMAIAMLLNNAGRIAAFRRDIQWHHIRNVLIWGMPACMAGAYGYTLLSARWVSYLLGAFLLISVPLRRGLHHFSVRLSPAGVRNASAFFGFVNGGMAGTGIILLSILMSAGVQGTALIGTDAVITIVLAVIKIAVFSGLAKINVDLAAVGLLIGLCTAPGGFIARWLLNHIPLHVHTWIMETMVIIGAVVLILGG
jgi:uncharacterized membrane protein YfcA